MRLDKNLWDQLCPEYEYAPNPIAPADLAHLTPSARAFISLWLELIQDDRAPATRMLRTLALPDQLAELRRALSHVRYHSRSEYRFHAALRQLRRRAECLYFNHPGRAELSRLIAIADDYFSLLSTSENQKLQNKLRKDYSIDNGTDVKKWLLTRLDHLASALHSLLRTASEYQDALITFLRDVILGQVAPLWRFLYAGTGAVEELLALSFGKGFSQEQLAELPIKYLRADRHHAAGDALDARLNLFLGAFGGQPQEYVVYLPLEGPALDIPGEVFPPGVTIINEAAWQDIPQEFGAEGETLEEATHGLRVKTSAYVRSYLTRICLAPQAQGEAFLAFGGRGCPSCCCV